jgi:hypothetical protein
MLMGCGESSDRAGTLVIVTMITWKLMQVQGIAYGAGGEGVVRGGRGRIKESI